MSPRGRSLLRCDQTDLSLVQPLPDVLRIEHWMLTTTSHLIHQVFRLWEHILKHRAASAISEQRK